jgi:hypothetical protein
MVAGVGFDPAPDEQDPDRELPRNVGLVGEAGGLAKILARLLPASQLERRRPAAIQELGQDPGLDRFGRRRVGERVEIGHLGSDRPIGREQATMSAIDLGGGTNDGSAAWARRSGRQTVNDRSNATTSVRTPRL